MKKAILATKVGMTQIFNHEDGVLIPVTVLQAGPCVVTQVKTVENDGYSAVQVGYVDKKDKIVTKDGSGRKAIAHRNGVTKAENTQMAKVSVYNIEGKEVDTIELNDAVFGVEVNEHLVHMAVVNQLANNRQGTQKAKTRSEVSGGGRKPWRQKGTGHARQGSTRAPQWTGGGVVFAPVPRDYSFKMNKKEKRAALKSALSSRVEENKFIVVDEMNFDEIKTKKFQNVLNNLNVNKALVVLEDGNINAEISARNIAGVKTARTNTINVYDILKYNTVIATKAAVATIEEVYA